MGEKKASKKRQPGEEEKKAGAKKPAAKKTGPKKAAAKKAGKPREEGAERRPEGPPSGEEGKPVASGETKAVPEEEAPGEPGREKDLSEEELRRLVEESLERVTVQDIVLSMMNQLASVGYLKLGLPESVNLKYRDFAQARLAIDTLEAMLKGTEGKVGEDALRPFRGTLANLQLNFVQLRKG